VAPEAFPFLMLMSVSRPVARVLHLFPPKPKPPQETPSANIAKSSQRLSSVQQQKKPHLDFAIFINNKPQHTRINSKKRVNIVDSIQATILFNFYPSKT
jgi:hypothetical protein